MSQERETYSVGAEESEGTGNPWSNAKATPLADIRALIDKLGHGNSIPIPMIPLDRDECYKRMLALEDALGMALQPLEALYPKLAEDIRAVARGEKKL